MSSSSAMQAKYLLAAANFLVLAALTVGCGSDDKQAPSDAAQFKVDAPLGEVNVLAKALEDLEPRSAPRTCAKVAGELDEVGTRAELAEVVAKVRDVRLAEVALEQQAAISSVMAACRGDAPLSVQEASTELEVTNQAMASLLEELE